MSRSIALGLALALASTPTLAAAPAFAAKAHNAFRLPALAHPQRYDVHLRPDMAKKRFNGNEVITLQIPRATRTLVLNSLGLLVSNVRLDGGAPLAPAQVVLHHKDQTVTLSFGHALAPGRHKLALSFAGKLTDEPRGLYIQPYQEGGKPTAMLATQFEPTDARRLFPLWDEPAYRASFALTVDLPHDFLGVSNMPISRKRPLGNGLDEVHFLPTPPMASYLMVLCAGHLEAVTSRVAGVDIRVVTTRGKRETGRYALDTLTKLLPYYNDYFGVRYPLPKLDLIAVPGGDGGAMENWGGIVFQDGVLLFDPRIKTEKDREEIFEFIAHEVAHQWFGNYVTMAWWDDLWLNEGFASWMESKAASHFHPEWPTWVYTLRKRHDALQEDALSTTHPVQQPILDATQADAAFDDITYDKGESVIRMLETAMGPDAFRAGIRRYMRAHAFGNARTADLWHALASATRLPVAHIAPRWIGTPGFPLVTAALQQGRLTVDQQRFVLRGNAPATAPWPVPMRVAEDGKPRTLLFEQAHTTLPVGKGTVKLNWGGVGFYRVAYDAPLLARLRAHLGSLPQPDQVDLLDDAWSLVPARPASVAGVLGLVDDAAAHAPVAVWAEVADILTDIADATQDDPRALAAIRSRVAPVAARLGWTPRPADGAPERQTRTTVLKLLARSGDAAAIAEAKARFWRAPKDPSAMAGDVRPAVLYAVGRSAEPGTYDELLSRARHADGFDEKQQYYMALAEATDEALAAKTLPLTISRELDPTLASDVLATVGKRHPALVQAFVHDHESAYFAKRTPLERLGILSAGFRRTSDEASAVALDALARKELPAETFDDLAKRVERIRARAALRTAITPALDTWTGAMAPGAQR